MTRCVRIALALCVQIASPLLRADWQPKAALARRRNGRISAEATSNDAAQSWETRTALRLIAGVKRRTGARPLDLLEDLFDAGSGLTGEGVWHNAHFGAAQLLAARR
eukprot:CAMPEP_0119282296 /NCGR_PEP_ID=MMETSP1329-20130426/26433_1 /TAXON_ID=114041 /ORGANISM="Genus nov. species nov., Strain RCC1024" /LENGTH=106 /DNA_ID=CAMNT_0007282949 /DNA_START=71 /DNA_END=387 /DNA_ORIENTATION=-